jgi:iron(III) transport system permease protein
MASLLQDIDFGQKMRRSRARVLDISMYLFVDAMTTVSAVIFLYSTDTKPAAVTIINIGESGCTAAAAAAMTIVATSAAVKVAHVLLTCRLGETTRAWRRR